MAAAHLGGDRRTIARAITAIENDPTRAESMRGALAPHLGRAHVVGITGPAGAGKSTLVNALVGELLSARTFGRGRRDRSVESI